jgi:hypothetical protein
MTQDSTNANRRPVVLAGVDPIVRAVRVPPLAGAGREPIGTQAGCGGASGPSGPGRPTPIRIRRGDRRLQATGESPPSDVNNSKRLLKPEMFPGILVTSLGPRVFAPDRRDRHSRPEPGDAGDRPDSFPDSREPVVRQPPSGPQPSGWLARIGPVGGNVVGERHASPKKPPALAGGVITHDRPADPAVCPPVRVRRTGRAPATAGPGGRRAAL